MKRKVLFVVIGVLIIICVMGAYLIKNKNYNESQVYTGVATVIQSPSFKKSIVEIRDTQGNIVGNSTIYSNVFWVGEQVTVEYSKKGKNYIISNIESIADSRKAEAKIISHISSDVTMRGYRELISIYTDKNEALAYIPALPEKIANQNYKKTVSPNEFFEIVRDIYGGVPQAQSNSKVMIEFIENASYKILSLKNIHTDGTEEEVSYIFDGQNFTFKSLESGIYSLRVEFKNEDIINYIFWME